MLIRLFLALYLIVAPIFAAAPDINKTVRKVAKYTFTLSGTAGLLTISLPADSTRTVYLLEAAMECSATCVFAQNLNGTLSGGTAVTPVVLNYPAATSPGSTSVATVYRDGTVSGGSALPTWTVPALNQAYAINLEHIVLRERVSTPQTYAISTGTVTGTVTIAITYAEEHG